MADLGFDTAEGDLLCFPVGKDFLQGRDFTDVARAGAGAVGFDERNGFWSDICIFVGAF